MKTLFSLWGAFNAETNAFGHVLFTINIVITTIFGALYMYQNFFILFSLLTKAKKYPEAKHNHKYAYIIAARDEEKVIGYLIDSIYKQDYIKENMQVFVVADNCSDKTADVARSHGAIVYERFNQEKKGKSYALEYLFSKLLVDYPDLEACVVFDADNLVSRNFTTELNKVYDLGYKVITTYRNSKNFSQNILTSGSGFCYLRECIFLHKVRSKLGLSTYVSGSGFLVDYSIIKKQNGWIQHLLIEDLQFSSDMLLSGEKIMYAHDAIFFDEQPSRLKDSWNQRMRWVKGLYQCFSGYIGRFIKAIFSPKKGKKYNRFELYEIGLFFAPIPAFTIIWLMIYNLLTGANLLLGNINFDYMLNTSIKTTVMYLFFFFCYGTAICALLIVTERKRIVCPLYKQILYCMGFTLFFFIYLPILLIAIFKKVTWKVIPHTTHLSIEDMDKNKHPK